MTADLTNPVFTNEEAAMAHLEASRWPDGAFCGYCGSTNVTRMGGRTQAGYFNCNDCRQKFTARVGTVLERSKVPFTSGCWRPICYVVQERHVALTSSTACSASPTRPLGSWRTAFAKP